VVETAPFKATFFTPDELTYPENSINIPDTVQRTFIDHYFLPWQASAAVLLDSLASFPGKELSYLETYLNDDAWYGENKKPHKKGQRQEIVDNINVNSFPNFQKKGIIIAHTNLRRIPSIKPGFDTYSKAGEGFPFDYFQETNLWANTPVQIMHLSEDKLWSYVVSPYYKGWVETRDLAIASDDFISQWINTTYCMPLSDSVNLSNDISQYTINAKMGTLLPYETITDVSDQVEVYYAAADHNQNAKILKAQVNTNLLAFKDLNFDELQLKSLITDLLGQPYGWGGNLENRDCSSMIRDLLGTYRIWLPRDSKDQMTTGDYVEFPETSEEKIKLIKDKGIPFFTILRKPGHNMLYVGDTPNGDPMILHAIWGLKTKYADKQLAEYLKAYPIEGIHQNSDGTLHGRHIIGEVVITSVHLGSDSPEMMSLLEEMYAMTTIPIVQD